jgi:ketosteroid isomerase-like protein
MSQENIEAFKRGTDAANRRDVDGVLSVLHPNVEWHAVLPMVGGDAVYRGHEGVREFLREVWEVLADTRFDFPDIRDVGDQIVAIGQLRGRGEASGVETETPFAYVVEYENGRATRVQAYLDPKEALEAAGLPLSQRD